MPYNLPTFNLTVGVFHGLTLPPGPPAGSPDISPVANLQYGRKLDYGASMPYTLLLPALTDVRFPSYLTVPYVYDIIEVPSGSGCWYVCNGVGDVGKGFSNEYRCAHLVPAIYMANLASWNFPVPMP